MCEGRSLKCLWSLKWLASLHARLVTVVHKSRTGACNSGLTSESESVFKERRGLIIGANEVFWGERTCQEIMTDVISEVWLENTTTLEWTCFQRSSWGGRQFISINMGRSELVQCGKCGLNFLHEEGLGKHMKRFHNWFGSFDLQLFTGCMNPRSKCSRANINVTGALMSLNPRFSTFWMHFILIMWLQGCFQTTQTAWASWLWIV